MRKLFLTLILGVTIFSFASAQSGKNALGLNLSLGGLNPQISYVRDLGNNALDFSFGLDIDNNDFGFSLAGYYDFNFNIAGGLGWYVGPGVFLGYGNNVGDAFSAGIAGIIGLNYQFNIPISINLQYGLNFDFLNTDTRWLYDGFAVGVRYHF